MRIFIMARKTTFLEKRKECTQTFKRMTRLNMRGYSDKMIHNNLSEVKNAHKRTENKEIHNVIYSYQPNYKTRRYNSSTKSSHVWSVRIQDSKSPPNDFKLELCTSSL